MTQPRKVWARKKRRIGICLSTIAEFEKVQNCYYHTIQKAKKECLQ